jgi:hypothetical protein
MNRILILTEAALQFIRHMSIPDIAAAGLKMVVAAVHLEKAPRSVSTRWFPAS